MDGLSVETQHSLEQAILAEIVFKNMNFDDDYVPDVDAKHKHKAGSWQDCWTW